MKTAAAILFLRRIKIISSCILCRIPFKNRGNSLTFFGKYSIMKIIASVKKRKRTLLFTVEFLGKGAFAYAAQQIPSSY